MKLRLQGDGGNGAALERASVPTRRWIHVAMVVDGVAARLFVDGAQVAMAPWRGRMTKNSQPLSIGAYPLIEGSVARTTDHLPAQVDEFLVYGRQLRDLEVSA